MLGQATPLYSPNMAFISQLKQESGVNEARPIRSVFRETMRQVGFLPNWHQRGKDKCDGTLRFRCSHPCARSHSFLSIREQLVSFVRLQAAYLALDRSCPAVDNAHPSPPRAPSPRAIDPASSAESMERPG